MINRSKFFASVRPTVFGGTMSQSQVDGCNDLLDALSSVQDMRWLAYMLATAYHETAHTMLPISEIGHGHGRPYGNPVNGHVYYGRGYVQLTWMANYGKMTPVVKEDLVANPELALRPDIAAKIMLYGMENGTFTGKKLSDYFTPTTSDWLNARRIINGTDCAALIAGYGRNFNIALENKP